MLLLDDFGKNKLTNQRILELARLGKADRVAVFIDRNISQEEISELKNSQLALDLHLDLKHKIETGKIKEGPFQRIFTFVFKYFFGTNHPKDVTADWERQIEKFVTLFGQLPDGLNSHQHVHFFPPYFRVAITLCKKFDIPHVRFGKNGISKTNHLTEKIISLLWKINLKKFKQSGLNSCRSLVSLDWLKNPEKFIQENRAEEIEIICHPERDEEYEILKNLKK